MAPLDWFFEGFGRIVDDVRHKVVEEPWFGKTVTQSTDVPEPQSLDQALGWAQKPQQPGEKTAEPQAHEQGIDR